MLEFTEIILKYSDILHNVAQLIRSAVHFEGAIQALDTLLNIYIMNSWLVLLILLSNNYNSCPLQIKLSQELSSDKRYGIYRFEVVI